MHLRIRFVLFSRRCPLAPLINIVSLTNSHERKGTPEWQLQSIPPLKIG